MSVSPPSPPDSPPTTTPAGLANLLHDAYAEVDSLRRELSATKKRTDHAERLAASLQAIRDNDKSKDAVIDIIKQWEQRALAAEQARDDADVKRSAIEASWIQLNHYLVQLESAAVDARAGFSRVVENGGPIVAPSHVPLLGGGSRHRGRVFPPTFPSLPLPPHPPTTGTRRPRTPSIDGYGHPPPKKSRPDYDAAQMYVDRHPPPPRMILPPPQPHLQPPTPHLHHRRPSRSHSRNSSRSSSSSTSVGDMIIQASEGQNGNGNPVDSIHHPLAPQSRRKHRHDDHRPSHVSAQHFQLPQHYDNDQQHARRPYPPDYQNDYRSSPKQAGTVIMAGAAASGEPLAQPGQAREFQTHIFAPVVTGAPVKKSKFPQGAPTSTASVSAPPAASHGEPPAQGAPVSAFPATNDLGQRICRQCGMAGRYKEGKCVEKWGPGPMGPGTVCDRCRKKMKRVERRGTLENQQSMGPNALASSASLSHLSNSRPQPHSTIHRTDTLPALPHSSSFNVSSSRSDFHLSSPRPNPLHSSTNSNPNGTQRPLRSPGPSIAAIRDIDDDIPTSAVPRGGAGSRSNSRNGIRPSGGRGTPVGTGDPKKTSPLKQHSTAAPGKGASRSPGSVMDVDADGDAEDDADEVEAAFEGLVALGEDASSGRAAMEVDADGAGDAEQELLEAVDAAEANSSSSSHVGRLKEEE